LDIAFWYLPDTQYEGSTLLGGLHREYLRS
jgi:hypothetical protein